LQPFSAPPEKGALIFFSPSTGTYSDLGLEAAANPLKPGDTSSSSLTLDWTGWEVIDASRGDAAYAVQLSPRSAASGAPYWALSSSIAPYPLSISDGQTALVAGRCETVAQDGRFRAGSWKLSHFVSQGSSINPAAKASGHAFSLNAQPFTLEHGPIGAGPTLAF